MSPPVAMHSEAEFLDALRGWVLEQGASHFGIADLSRIYEVWPDSFVAYGRLLTGVSILIPENTELLRDLPASDDASRTSHYALKIALAQRLAGEVRDRLIARGHRAAVLNHPPRPPEKPTSPRRTC